MQEMLTLRAIFHMQLVLVFGSSDDSFQKEFNHCGTVIMCTSITIASGK